MFLCKKSGAVDAVTKNAYTDVPDRFWANTAISTMTALGLVGGYADGTFRPDKLITRAQAATMINRVLDRIPETHDDLHEYMVKWPDNHPDDWYYIAMQEATNSHDHVDKGEVHETWTAMTAIPDWTHYEN